MTENTEACECVVRLLRSVSDGKAACPRHKVWAEKVDGVITASHRPFLSPLPLANPLAELHVR